MENLNCFISSSDNNRITFRLKNGFSYVKQSDILWCKKETEQTTRIKQTNDSCLIAAHSFSYLEKLLPSLQFYRINTDYLINISYVHQWKSLPNAYLLMAEGLKISLSSEVREDLLAKIPDREVKHSVSGMRPGRSI